MAKTNRGSAFLLFVVCSWAAVNLLSWGVAQAILMVLR
jgi:hypothetical protein